MYMIKRPIREHSTAIADHAADTGDDGIDRADDVAVDRDGLKGSAEKDV